MKQKFLIINLIFVMLFCYTMPALAEEDFSINDLDFPAKLDIISPDFKQSYINGKEINLKAKGNGYKSYKIMIKYNNGQSKEDVVNSEDIDFSFIPENASGEINIEIKAYKSENLQGYFETINRTIPSAKQEIISNMIDLAYKNSKDKKYCFAPAEEDHHIGVCKNFVMRLFDTYSKSYRMAEYPDLELHMPKNKSLKDSKPYQYGLEWRSETAEQGSPFEIVEQFKYDNNLSYEENYELAHNLMKKVQKGDFFQMVGNYGGGNGPHSLFFIEDYENANDTLHWTDSNMFGKRVNGVRWGYMQYNAAKSGQWFAKVFCSKNRGATLYRLRDDLIKIK